MQIILRKDAIFVCKAGVYLLDKYNLNNKKSDNDSSGIFHQQFGLHHFHYSIFQSFPA